MIPILYESTETAFMTNGLCRLRDMLTAEVTEERNAGFYLDFTYPVDGANFDQIRPGRIVTVTHDDTGAVEPFDIVSYSRAVDGVVSFHAVHISYRLSGMTAWASNINSLADGLTVFNNISGQPFTFSADFTSGVYIAAFDGVPRTVRQIMGGVEGSILDACGGEWEYKRFNVTLKKSRGADRGVMIRYGVNLVDYKEDADYSGTYNAVVPYWTGNDNGNEVIVRGSRVNYGQPTYAGRDIIAPLDLTEKFETKPTAAQLNTMAASVMTARRPTIPQNSITVDFIRLRDLPEFADVQSLLDCKLCDTVGVTFPLYGMAASFKIVKTVWDPLGERYTAMELGSLSTSLSEALGISQGGTFTETSGGSGVADVMMNGASIVDTDGIAMVTDAAGNMTLDGSLYFGNARTIYMKDTGGTYRAVVSESTSNNTVIGYGGYDASQGGTNIYGNTVRVYSRNEIQFNQPLAGLVKLTEYQFSTPAMNAHTYESTVSATLPAQTGYIPVGIVGWRVGNYHVNAFTLRLNGRTIYGGFSNPYNSNVAASTCTVNILWLKATEA